MNKSNVDALIPRAYKIIEEVGIAKEGKVANGYRGQIAKFGAAVSMGSLLSAVAFFSEEESSSAVDRSKLMLAIYRLIHSESEGTDVKPTENETEVKESSEKEKEKKKKNKNKKVKLFNYIIENKDDINEIKEKVFDAALAIKLAINMYEIEKK
jgi:hypothetical protein